MQCNNNITSGLFEYRDMNKNIIDKIYALPDHARKIVRLLAKQYHILSVELEAPINQQPSTGRIIRENHNAIINYTDYNSSEKVFTWKIKLNK